MWISRYRQKTTSNDASGNGSRAASPCWNVTHGGLSFRVDA